MSQSTNDRSNQENGRGDENLIPESNLCVEIASAEGIHEIDLGNSRTYIHPVPRLEDMATVVVALRLWDTYNRIEYDTSYGYVTVERCLRKMNQVADQLDLPKAILNKIKPIAYRMQEQITYRREDADKATMRDMRQICKCEPDDKNAGCHRLWLIVWNPNGLINYRKTALKILSCPKKCGSGTDTMFRVIAAFCFEDYLNEFPIHLLSEELIREVIQSERPSDQITRYWIERKKNSQYFALAHSRLLDTLRNASNPKLAWPVYDYFWNTFEQDDQVAIARKLISAKDFRKYQMDLFFKLNRNQLRIMYSKQPVEIILNFMYCREFDWVRAAWRCVRHSISGPQFEEMINFASDRAKKTGEYVDLLIGIWNSAPPTLIEYMMTVKDFEIADNFFSIDEGNNFIITGKFKIVVESLRFLIAVLSKADAEITKKYLVEKGPFIICEYDTNVFDSIVQSTLGIADQQEVKENTLLKVLKLDSSCESKRILHRFKKLLTEGREKIDEFLSFFTTKVELQTKLKSKLIPSNLFQLNKGHFNADDWSNVSNLIDQVYPNERRSSKRKRKILFSTFNAEKESKSPCELCFRRNGDERYDELDQILKSILPENEVVKFKQPIINDFRAKLFSSYCPSIRDIRMDKFVHWCFSGDTVKMTRFKAHFPIRKAFDVFFCQIVREYAGYFSTGKVSFAPLDSLLCWKFPSELERRKFKQKKILGIVNGADTDHLWGDYEVQLEEIIRWVFDDDEAKIRKFNKTYDEDQMKRLIQICNIEEISDGCEEYYFYRSDLSDSFTEWD